MSEQQLSKFGDSVQAMYEAALATARAEVAALGAVSKSTKDKYVAMIRRMVNGRAAPRTKRAARLYRAALVWNQRSTLAKLLEEWDAMSSPDCLAKITNQLEILNEIRSCVLANGRGTRSKRTKMELLPPAWQMKLIDAAEGTPMYELLAVMALTGTRPAELEKGIELHIKGDTLEIKVSGAKFDDHRGHEIRILAIPLGNPLAKKIVSHMNLEGDERCGLRCDPDLLRRNLRDLARDIYPELDYSVTPYTFRHALASACKRSSLDPKEIAQILGHRSTKSQTYYGRASLDQSGLPVEVRATTSGPVRDNARNLRNHLVVSGDTDVPHK